MFVLKTEIGDVLVEMIYTDEDELLVLVKTLKLASKTSVDNFLGEYSEPRYSTYLLLNQIVMHNRARETRQIYMI